MIRIPLRHEFAAVVLAGCLVVVASAQELAVSPDRRTSPAVSGDVTTRYAVRSADSDYDHDVYQDLRLRVNPFGDDRFGFYLAAGGKIDLDGERNESGYFPLEDISDTTPYAVFGTIYEAFIEGHDVAPSVSLIRVGRQAGVRDEAVLFDGATLGLSFRRAARAVLYGGVAVHLQELEARWGTDQLFGLGVDVLSLSRLRVGIDYLFVSDQRELIADNDQQDHLMTLQVWETIVPVFPASLRVRLVDLSPRDLTFRFLAPLNRVDSEITGSYLVQFSTQNELSNELSQFYDVLGATAPYQRADLTFRYLPASRIGVDVGLTIRDLWGESVESALNRDYGKGVVAVSAADLVADGVSITVSGEVWYSGADRSFTGGAEAVYDFYAGARAGSARIGTYFSLYKYDDYDVRGERESIRTFFARARLPIATCFIVGAEYELEHGRDLYHSGRIGFVYEL